MDLIKNVPKSVYFIQYLQLILTILEIPKKIRFRKSRTMSILLKLFNFFLMDCMHHNQSFGTIKFQNSRIKGDCDILKTRKRF